MAHPTHDSFDLPEVYSFIVRVWVDERNDENLRTRWHGQITDVSNGDRHYFKSLKEIQEYIESRLHLKSGK